MIHCDGNIHVHLTTVWSSMSTPLLSGPPCPPHYCLVLYVHLTTVWSSMSTSLLSGPLCPCPSICCQPLCPPVHSSTVRSSMTTQLLSRSLLRPNYCQVLYVHPTTVWSSMSTPLLSGPLCPSICCQPLCPPVHSSTLLCSCLKN